MTLQDRSGWRAWGGNAGLSLVEILVAGLIIGTAVIGLSLMFATGSAWVSGMGDDRAAAGLAQQGIEQMRAALIANWDAAVPADEIADPAGCDVQSDARCRQTPKYRRVTSIECVDDSSPTGLGNVIACPSSTDPLRTKRITVSITPLFVVDDQGTQVPVQKASGVTLQGWISPLGR